MTHASTMKSELHETEQRLLAELRGLRRSTQKIDQLRETEGVNLTAAVKELTARLSKS